MRIVSLVASATEIVHALGLGQLQAGRSHECDYPPEVKRLPVCSRPRVDVSASSHDIDAQVRSRVADASSVYEVLSEVVDELRPTHLITQTLCRVCAVSLEDVEAAMSAGRVGRPQVIGLEPNSLADISRDILRVAEACGAVERGRALCAEIEAGMAHIADRARVGPRRRIAVIEWIEPLMAAGNWMPELVDLAGGADVFGEAGRHSAAISFGALAAADPDVMVVAPCGFDLTRTRREMGALTDRPDWQRLRAVREGCVFLVDGNQYMARPGPRIADSLRILAETIHPEAFEPSFRGAAWEPL